MDELITVRKSKSVIGTFNVYLEKGLNRYPLAIHLKESEAIALARAKSHLLKIECKLFTLHPDFETIVLHKDFALKGNSLC